jgi:hypothetical protein
VSMQTEKISYKRHGAVRQMRTSLRLPNPTQVSGCKKAAPLGESSDAVGLVVFARCE